MFVLKILLHRGCFLINVTKFFGVAIPENTYEPDLKRVNRITQKLSPGKLNLFNLYHGDVILNRSNNS